MSPEERFRANEHIVKWYARKLYKTLRIDYDDALAWGSLGLWQAVHRDHEAWEAYMRKRVDGAIRDGARLWHGRYRHEESRPQFVPLSNRYTPHYEPEEYRSYSKLLAAFSLLDAREADILRSHYFAHEPLQDIAERFGGAPARVSQIKKRALRKVRAFLVGEA